MRVFTRHQVDDSVQPQCSHQRLTALRLTSERHSTDSISMVNDTKTITGSTTVAHNDRYTMDTASESGERKVHQNYIPDLNSNQNRNLNPNTDCNTDMHIDYTCRWRHY